MKTKLFLIVALVIGVTTGITVSAVAADTRAAIVEATLVLPSMGVADAVLVAATAGVRRADLVRVAETIAADRQAVRGARIGVLAAVAAAVPAEEGAVQFAVGVRLSQFILTYAVPAAGAENGPARLAFRAGTVLRAVGAKQ